MRKTLLGLAMMMVVSCSTGRLGNYDPAEVEYLLAQARAANLDVSRAVLIDTLEFRADCRTMQGYLIASSQGIPGDLTEEAFRAIPQRQLDRGQVDMFGTMSRLVERADAGDPGPTAEFVIQNCQDPPGAPGGIDSVQQID